MAELTSFSFFSGNSILHNMDPRFKLIFLMIISITSLKASLIGLFILSLFFILIIIHIRISIISIIKEVRYFIVLLVFVFTARALSSSGDILFEFMSFKISMQGVHEGILICWRLAVVMLMGLSFMATTRPSQIRNTVAWYLKPVPMIPEKRIATMLSLLMRFIPVILNQAAKTSEAQKARGIEQRKNPVYRVIKFTIPFMRKTFEDADRLVLAMEARCYCENRTIGKFEAAKSDWFALFIVAGLCFIIYKL